MAALPTGTVTFLFTDIEGSTTLLQHLGNFGGPMSWASSSLTATGPRRTAEE
jgi:hypothetical protein